MILDRFKPVKRDDFVVIDSQFPQKEPFAFRNTEINEYLKRFANVHSYAMYPMTPDSDAWFSHSYGVGREAFNQNLAGYLKYHPENKDRISYLEPRKRYKFKLAYSFFLGETYVLLPFYERHKIPFVFVLYPGGCFELDNKKSDAMLRKIFRSPYFRGVIVTQEFTQDYLTDHKLCPADKITYVYGSFSQFRRAELRAKHRYKIDKPYFDVCFVAAKYSERGIDKGYDVFVETARRLSKSAPNARFHVVGGLTSEDIDVSELGTKITFYGYRRPDFLLDFYSKMDIFMSPNRPFKITSGNFDGFPLGIDASYCGVALFIADPLGLNHHYTDRKDAVIIPHNAEKVADLAMQYYREPAKLYELATNGQVLTQKLFDTDYQIEERIRVFGRFVQLAPRQG